VTSSATEAVDIDEERKHRHAVRHHAHHEKTKMSPIPSYAAMALLFCLCAGALLQVLAQFFGVLGLTITATGTQGPSTGQNVGVSLWTVDVALSRYATVAWTFSLATAAMTLLAYRIPRFAKLV
jgi:Trk-type K+ transport system membrane component